MASFPQETCSALDLSEEWLQPFRPRRLRWPVQGRVFQLPSKRQAMSDARQVLTQLRSIAVHLSVAQQTEYVVQVLRQICPFVFEELLLHCLEDADLKVQRNPRFVQDTGSDGAFWMGDDKFLLQAKRYSGRLKSRHFLAFCARVERDPEAVGGLLIHTGHLCSTLEALEQQSRHTSLLDHEGLRQLVMQTLSPC